MEKTWLPLCFVHGDEVLLSAALRTKKRTDEITIVYNFSVKYVSNDKTKNLESLKPKHKPLNLSILDQ